MLANVRLFIDVADVLTRSDPIASSDRLEACTPRSRVLQMFRQTVVIIPALKRIVTDSPATYSQEVAPRSCSLVRRPECLQVLSTN